MEDLKQECYIEAIKVIREGKWDSTRPLKTFLYIHLRNRLYNLKRNKYQRLATPCEKCPLNAYVKDTDHCLQYETKDECKLYAAWLKRNNTKKALMHPIDIETIFNSHATTGLTPAEISEYLDWVEQRLPEEFLETWKLARNGERYNNANFEIIIGWIKENLSGDL